MSLLLISDLLSATSMHRVKFWANGDGMCFSNTSHLVCPLVESSGNRRCTGISCLCERVIKKRVKTPSVGKTLEQEYFF